ncbi:MAG: IS110 family RNA-guided transposase [Isosphaeraceae bacterium]
MPSPVPDGQGQSSLALHRYGVGVDCHSRFFQVCILIPEGTRIVKLERRVPATWPELRAAKAWLLHELSEHGIAVSPGDLRYTCESTGQYHMPLCLAWRGSPAIINPSDTGHVRRKTDRLDAEKLAQHSLHGLWRQSWMAPDEIQELRVLANQRAKLVAERSRLTNRINSDLLRFGHVVGQLGKINGPIVRALVEDFCANGSVAMHRDYFSDIRIPPGVALVFDQRWGRIDALDREIKTIEGLCMSRTDELTWRIGEGRTASGSQLSSNLRSIPGVGPQTVVTWLAEVGDVTRFASTSKLLAYVGLDPSDQISAGKVTGTKARKGNARLHAALRHAARAMLAHAPSCKFAMWARGYMGRHHRAGKSKAAHALARRIGKALYYCHLKNEPFDDSRYQALLGESGYPLCPVEEMGFNPGVVGNLKANGLRTSRQVVEAFYSDLGRRPGCGRATVAAVAGWIEGRRDRRQDGGRKPRGTDSSGDLPAAKV